MLFKGVQKEVDRKAIAGSFIYNTNRIAELTVDGSDSTMFFTKNFLESRNPAHEYKLDDTTTAIKAFYGGDDTYVDLPVLKKKVDGLVSTFAKTVTIGVDKIAYGYSDPDDASKSWLECYPNGFKKVIYQVSLSLDQISGLNNLLTFKFLDSLNAAFSGGDRTGTINYATGAIAISVPAATVVTALVSSWTVNSNCVVKVSTTVQVSGTTTNDFTSPVEFVVSNAAGQSKTFTVTVTVLP